MRKWCVLICVARYEGKKLSKLVLCIDLLKLHLLQMSCLISHEAFWDYIKQQKKMQALFSKPR